MRRTYLTIIAIVLLVSIFLGITIAVYGKENTVKLSSPEILQTNLMGEAGYSVFQLSDGSLILNSANQSCTFLTKLDVSYHVLWTKTIQIDQKPTVLPRLVPTHDGGYILGGIVNNMYVLVKTDSQGNLQWTKMLSSEAPINYFMSIIQTRDNGFAIAGFGEKAEDSEGWIWFAKTDSSGKLLWNETISGPLANCPSTIFQTSNGGYVLSDVSYSFDPNQAFFSLIKLNAIGNVLGNTTYGGKGYYFQPECNFAITTKDGGYLMAGYLWQKNAWLVKIDTQGNMEWNQTYGKTGSSITGALEIPNRGYLLVTISNQTDAGLMITDKTGKILWNTNIQGVTLPVGLEANFNSIINDKNRGYIMIGSKNQSVWLAKFDFK